MHLIGAHLSNAKGYLQMGKDALSIGANTFQFFTRNPRGAKARTLDPEDIQALGGFMAEHGFGKVIAHAPYTLNACSANARTRELAVEMLADDLSRMEYLPGNFYNFHPGSHSDQGAEAGVGLIAEVLNAVLKPSQNTVILLETMAGKGSEVGRSFRELRAIIDRVELQDKLGVCFDACHLHDAGYNIAQDLDGVLEEFDQTVGLRRLRAFHLNDSMNPMGSRRDRHAKIGEGTIGLEAILRMMTHPALRELPFVLETPTDLEGHGQEIALLRGKLGE